MRKEMTHKCHIHKCTLLDSHILISLNQFMSLNSNRQQTGPICDHITVLGLLMTWSFFRQACSVLSMRLQINQLGRPLTVYLFTCSISGQSVRGVKLQLVAQRISEIMDVH